MSITAYKIESVGHDRTGKDYGYVNIMYRYGNKRSCPQPDQCEKMEVMWADESAFAIICLYCSFTLSGASICTFPLKPNTQPKKVGLADTSVCTLKEVISYARVVTSSPKRSTIVFIRLLSHRKSTRTFSPENIKNTSFVKFSISKSSSIGIISLASISGLNAMRSTLKFITFLCFSEYPRT